MTSNTFSTTCGNTYLITAYETSNQNGTRPEHPASRCPGAVHHPRSWPPTRSPDCNNCHDDNYCYQWAWWFNATSSTASATVGVTFANGTPPAPRSTSSLSPATTRRPPSSARTPRPPRAVQRRGCAPKTDHHHRQHGQLPRTRTTSRCRFSASDETIGTAPTWTPATTNLFFRSAIELLARRERGHPRGTERIDQCGALRRERRLGHHRTRSGGELMTGPPTHRVSRLGQRTAAAPETESPSLRRVRGGARARLDLPCCGQPHRHRTADLRWNQPLGDVDRSTTNATSNMPRPAPSTWPFSRHETDVQFEPARGEPAGPVLGSDHRNLEPDDQRLHHQCLVLNDLESLQRLHAHDHVLGLPAVRAGQT